MSKAGVYLDWGTVLSTKRNMAFSEGSWIRFLMIHMNWATVMSDGTRYFRLSMSTICEPDTFSTITWWTQERANKGYKVCTFKWCEVVLLLWVLHTHTHSLSLSHTHTLSLSHTHTHTHTRSLALTHSHTHRESAMSGAFTPREKQKRIYSAQEMAQWYKLHFQLLF